MKTQIEEWKEASWKLQEEVMFDLDLVSATEIRTCYFKLQPRYKESERNLEKPRTALRIKLATAKFF